MKKQLEAMGGKGPLVEQVVDIEILYQKAIERGLHDKPESQAQIAIATRKALADMAIQAAVNEQMTERRCAPGTTGPLPASRSATTSLVKDEARRRHLKALARVPTSEPGRGASTQVEDQGGWMVLKAEMGGRSARPRSPPAGRSNPYGYRVIP
jgi:hypothetical protein